MPENPHTWLHLLREIGQTAGAGLAATLAVLVKLLLSPTLSPRRALGTASAAMLAAWVGTDPLCHLLGWEGEQMRTLSAALLALTGENIVRRILDLSDNPAQLKALWDIWRGRK
ncbi:MAG: hypothetical protein Q4G49_15975 [Paracoccus sp. (in: a-proteobacteria)]|nr:hypothetical protein [Paracoccus sp. (in: a-proteobacteria)]